MIYFRLRVVNWIILMRSFLFYFLNKFIWFIYLFIFSGLLLICLPNSIFFLQQLARTFFVFFLCRFKNKVFKTFILHERAFVWAYGRYMIHQSPRVKQTKKFCHPLPKVYEQTFSICRMYVCVSCAVEFHSHQSDA